MKLKIKELSGVCSVNKDTKRLAEIASVYKKNKILDLGTGTGYCGIWLAKQGVNVDATDINRKAIHCTKINSKLNNVKMNIFFSDLFKNIIDKYDLIIYNPPVNDNETDFQRRIKAILRKSPLKNLMSKLAIKIYKKKRVNSLNYFISEAKKYLIKDGVLLIHIFINDIKYLNKESISLKQKEKVFSHTAIYEIKYKNKLT